MPSEQLEIPIEAPHLASVPALLDQPDEAREVALLFAHGSRFGKDSPWTRGLVQELVAQGFRVLSFDYAYRARQAVASVPSMDSLELLEHVHARALQVLDQRCPGARLVLAGKSLGARLSTLLAAKGERCHGLALFGYPLHNESKRRIYSEHFGAIAQPTLFLQGGRDPYCDLDTLRRELPRLGGQATLHEIAGADHGFFREQDGEDCLPSVFSKLAQYTAAWADATWPS